MALPRLTYLYKNVCKRFSEGHGAFWILRRRKVACCTRQGVELSRILPAAL
jgi:hypothetical protein